MRRYVIPAPDLRRRTILLPALGALPIARAFARTPFPDRPVRIVVPYSVGLGPDVVARSLAERMSRQWGQPVVVDNKPGASGIVAFAEVRRVAPDGHTLLVADTATLAVNPLLNEALPYDPVRDIVPLTMLFRATFVILVGGSSRFASLRKLLDAARRARNRKHGRDCASASPRIRRSTCRWFVRGASRRFERPTTASEFAARQRAMRGRAAVH